MVLQEIAEIGVLPGDHIVLAPGDPEYPYCLVRPLARQALRWAFTPSCELEWTKPATPTPMALRQLRDAVSYPPHLTILH